MNIKNIAVERLAAEVARATGETKTEAIRRALEERWHRLAQRGSGQRQAQRLEAFLVREIWPQLEGLQPISKKDREEILGYGEDGV
jgi:antitoxin VapB